MNVYLSIDLDYWQKHRNPKACTAFFQKVWKLGLPVYVVMDHHHLLPHVNASDCDTLVNVDYHSDLADVRPGYVLDFGEGTWTNFVDWRWGGTLIWHYPDARCLSCAGYCHDQRNPFADPAATRWSTARKRAGLGDIPWQHIKALGVSVSPNWLGRTSTLVEPLTKLRVGHWLTDFYRKAERNQPCRRQPKTVRRVL